MRRKGMYAVALTCALIFGPALTVSARQADTEKAEAIRKINRRTRQMNPTSVRRDSYRISGRINAAGDGHLIRDRRMNYPAASGRGIYQKDFSVFRAASGGVLNPSFAIKKTSGSVQYYGFKDLLRLCLSWKRQEES